MYGVRSIQQRSTGRKVEGVTVNSGMDVFQLTRHECHP